MQNVWEKEYVEMKKHFFQWPSGNNIKIATLASFESLIPSVTCNSVLCYFFPEIFWDQSSFKKRKLG